MSTCRSCQARIIWVKTPAGKSMPLNADPDPDGNVAIVDGLAVVITDAASLVAGERRFTSHFASCPEAAKHRKPKA